MAGKTVLEQKLRILLEQYTHLKQDKVELLQLAVRHEARIQELEAHCHRLRTRIDEMDRDRFSVKRFKDERGQIRRKLESAVERLTLLEQEL